MGSRTVVLVGLVLGCTVACSAEQAPPPPAPPIPKIVPPTSASRVPVMVDRPLPDDCELVVPVEVMNQRLGRELPGEPRLIIGIPEPALGRTGKIDCYYGLAQGQQLAAAPVVIGLSAYNDEATARGRVTDSVSAERQEGGAVSEVEVGKQKGSLVVTRDERLLLGSLGKTTFVVRVKAGVVPDDQVGPVLAALAAQSMTPTEDV
ncbi:hypothetical protein [Saccharothrix coeruleofusca]|nr:hypothetical protein [Saccharothrix coeruleofusca]MBP2338142.1 hypothetical protein [Saccharothrix coeruleofusca]